MYELLLIRHGKSSWVDTICDDHDRTLKKRGRREALKVGEMIAHMGKAPHCMLVSSALRAQETALQLNLSFDTDLVTLPALYSAGVEDLEYLIRNYGQEHQRIALVGHNPTFTEAVHRAGYALANLPTATAALFDCAAIQSWRTFSFSEVSIEDIISPKK